MTQLGFCHNATFPESRITPEMATRLGIQWVRTIVYDPSKHANSFDDVIASAAELKADGVNVNTLVVFNSESFMPAGVDGGHDNIPLMTERLDAFLTQANGAVAAIEPGNELDHEAEFHLDDQTIVKIGLAAAEVCRRHNVKCLSPSLLTGPEEGHFETIARGLGGQIDAMAVHPYYCSIDGKPWDRFVYDSVEHKSQICDQLGRQPLGLSTWFTELGCPTGDAWLVTLGEEKLAEIRNRIGREPTLNSIDQAAFTAALRRFQHPAIEVVFQFALFDTMVPIEERAIGKDFGLIGMDNVAKASLPELGGIFA
jgi:hypothetical protein